MDKKRHGGRESVLVRRDFADLSSCRPVATILPCNAVNPNFNGVRENPPFDRYVAVKLTFRTSKPNGRTSAYRTDPSQAGNAKLVLTRQSRVAPLVQNWGRPMTVLTDGEMREIVQIVNARVRVEAATFPKWRQVYKHLNELTILNFNGHNFLSPADQSKPFDENSAAEIAELMNYVLGSPNDRAVREESKGVGTPEKGGVKNKKQKGKLQNEIEEFSDWLEES